LEQNVERFFVMGLLHDIGKLPIFTQIPEAARCALIQSRKKRHPLYLAESDIMGFNHAAVGATLAKSWRLSLGQQEALAYHHRPDFALRYKGEAAIIHIADILAHVLAVGSSPLSFVPAFVPEAWGRLSLDTEILDDLLVEAGSKLKALINQFFSAEAES
jgi:HD-like signal output (HDOD) protein